MERSLPLDQGKIVIMVVNQVKCIFSSMVYVGIRLRVRRVRRARRKKQRKHQKQLTRRGVANHKSLKDCGSHRIELSKQFSYLFITNS